MAVIVCTSGPGAPGVTTTALALALTWPRHVLLADCDREPAQSVLAGFLRGLDAGGRGLPSVAQAHREHRPLDDELWLHTVALLEHDTVERRFLPGFAQPGAVRLFDGVWGPLGAAFDVLDARGIDVLVDAGRIGAGLPAGLAQAADAVVVVARANLRSLGALRLHLPTLREQLTGLPVAVPVGLGVVGPGQPYATAEIAGQFELEPWFELPHDQRAAGVLLDGDPEPKRFHDGGFMARARAAAQELAQRVATVRSSREALAHA